MKKTMCFVISLLLAGVMCACGETGEEQTNKNTTSSVKTTTTKVKTTTKKESTTTEAATTKKKETTTAEPKTEILTEKEILSYDADDKKTGYAFELHSGDKKPYFNVEMNSVGGIGFEFEAVYIGEKDVKYLTLNIVFYNSVDDIAYNEIADGEKLSLQIVGPLVKNQAFTIDCIDNPQWYATTAKKAVIESIDFEFKDGTTATLPYNKSSKIHTKYY
jgi:uncharacterized protein YxeA